MAKLFAFSSSQYMTVNSAPVTAAPFTVSCWFKPTAFAANARFVSIGDVDVTNEQWSLGCNTLGRVRWGAQTSAGEAFATYTGAAMSVGTWYHCAGVEASATSRLAYLDAASATNTTSRAPAGADSLFIGAKAASTPSDFADGDIAEVGVWDVALTADEIAVLARGYSPLFVRPGNLIFYMPLVRANVEMVGGLALSEVNTPTVSTHCRVFYPARPYVSIPAAAGGGITQEIGQVTETDLAQSFTVLKLKQIGQPAEADTAQVFAPLKTEQIGQPTEADTAQPITVAKTAQIGQVVETNLAQIVTSLKTLAVNPVNEQDAAQAITALKTGSVAQATETNLAQPVTATFGQTISQVTETDLAQIVSTLKAKAIDQVTETDLAQPVTATFGQFIGQVVETDLAQPVMALKVAAIGQVIEADMAQVVTSLKTTTVGQAIETDLAQALAKLKAATIGQATETDFAFALILESDLIDGLMIIVFTARQPSVTFTSRQPSIIFSNQ